MNSGEGMTEEEQNDKDFNAIKHDPSKLGTALNLTGNSNLSRKLNQMQLLR